MLFGRKKQKDQLKKPETIQQALAEGEDAPTQPTQGEENLAPVGDSTGAEESEVKPNEDSKSSQAGLQSESQAPSAVATYRNPQDANELESTRGYLNFGSILVPAKKDQKVRLDIDQKSKRVVSLTITEGDATIQVQAFSAPKSGGIWEEVRGQIEESVVKQKGRVRHLDGPFGKELHARVPTVLKDGRQGWRAARFIGFEGNRWFLRGVIGGRGAIDRKAAEQVELLFSRLAVSRGDQPLPPRELLPLQPPAGAKRMVVPRGNPAATREANSPQVTPGDAPGPEITGTSN